MRGFWGLLILAVAAALGLMLIGRGDRAGTHPTLQTPRSVSEPAPVVEEPSERDPAAYATPTRIDAPSKRTIDVPAPPASKPAPPVQAGNASGSVRPVTPEPSGAGAPIKPSDPAASLPPAPAGDATKVKAEPPTVAGASQGPPTDETPAVKPEEPKNRGWAATGVVGPPRPEEAEAAALQAGLDAALGLSETAEGPASEIVIAPFSDPKAAGSAPTTPADAKARLEVQDDGSTLVDGRFVLRGKGTHAEPYAVSWEVLVSAQETYQPRLGRKNIPERLKMLDGKWVRIAGYIAFPIMAQSHDEMLMMLNQWDGCCIGVPPTPYDAIEVKLKAAAKGDDRLRSSGSVTGVLRVDPYLVKDWLVSLYLMDDAELTVEGAARDVPPGQHPAPQ